MASKIQIYNMALSHLGMQKIFDTTSDDPRQNACNLYWYEALLDTYSELGWTFATVKEQFALVSGVTVPGWDYIYAYPPKASVVRYVYSEGNVDYKEEQEYEVIFLPSLNKRVVCSNESEAYQEYTYIVEDTTLFSPKFVMAQSFKLAALMAQTLTNDPAIATNMRSNSNVIIDEAKRINAKEKIKKKKQTSELLNSRES